ncbi:hypothetical protein L593_08575 [Salinarchaeum sp. Harcht-Bsk1]|uniref:hypothetical protein n=1 Tax=Salinarchaeum sp. Harcht-Bsk1 TaxID=1333523 RepID=UPI000342332C|nr:hypothetical protein [Salinarchaeum sp. Harcht-Bsk1]AGN01660.1 hypothetical protein L593_08575 [Salinarchaeum sp. Harcht-Bsk1]
MELRNSEGSPIDPVPFLVVALLGICVAMAWGPLYLKSHGLGELLAIGVSGVLAVGTVGAAFYRFVWTENPNRREEVPVGERFRTLLYAMLLGILILLALIALLYV